jgi:hypothetical protein
MKRNGLIWLRIGSNGGPYFVPDQLLNNVWCVYFHAAALVEPKSELCDLRGSVCGRASLLFLISCSDLISTYSLRV